MIGYDAPSSDGRGSRVWPRRFALGACAPLSICQLLSLTTCAVLIAASPACAQSEAVSEVNREYVLKAAFLYNFGHYIEWPSEAADTEKDFVIGILGTDPFGMVLDDIAATKKLGARTIVVRRFHSMEEYRPCQILFVVASASAEQKAAAVARTRGTHVLLVGEEPGFTQAGGIVNFYIEQNKVRFEINPETAKREQLKISSRLMSLSRPAGQ